MLHALSHAGPMYSSCKANAHHICMSHVQNMHVTCIADVHPMHVTCITFTPYMQVTCAENMFTCITDVHPYAGHMCREHACHMRNRCTPLSVSYVQNMHVTCIADVHPMHITCAEHACHMCIIHYLMQSFLLHRICYIIKKKQILIHNLMSYHPLILTVQWRGCYHGYSDSLNNTIYTLSHLENDRDIGAWYRIKRLLSRA